MKKWNFVREVKATFVCMDCNNKKYFYGDGYMAIDELWYKYGVGKKCLCLNCFEKRVGGELNRDDFRGSVLNDYNFEYWMNYIYPLREWNPQHKGISRNKKVKRIVDYFERGIMYFKKKRK